MRSHRNMIRDMMAEIASGEVKGVIHVMGRGGTSQGEREVMIAKAARPARQVSHLTSKRGGKQYKNHVEGVTDPFHPAVWHDPHMTRGDADAEENVRGKRPTNPPGRQATGAEEPRSDSRPGEAPHI
jgi:hypothetical protein